MRIFKPKTQEQMLLHVRPIIDEFVSYATPLKGSKTWVSLKGYIPNFYVNLDNVMVIEGREQGTIETQVYNLYALRDDLLYLSYDDIHTSMWIHKKHRDPVLGYRVNTRSIHNAPKLIFFNDLDVHVFKERDLYEILK